MINRINLVLRAKNITARQFAEEIGIQPSGMSHILGGRNNPSLEFITKVLRRYPELDANWLLLGKGEMYTSTPHDMPAVYTEEEVATDEEPLQEPLAQSAEEQEPEIPYVSPRIAAAPQSEERNLERILFIYNDNTFREIIPEYR